MTGSTTKRVSLKRFAQVMPSNVDKHSVEGESEVRLCNYVDVYKNERISDDIDFMKATASDAQIERFTLKSQDVIITKDSEEPTDIGIPAFVPNDLPGVVCGYHLSILRPDRNKLNGGFLHWYLQSAETNAYYSTAATGISRYALSINDIAMTPMWVPSTTEQERIANFLDDKTARIDALIAEKERLAESLIDAQDSEISRLVTEGCLLNAQMAISSIPWLPTYPAHWRLASLKHIVDVRDGTHETPVYVIQSDDSFPLVTSKDVSSGCLLFENTKHISREDYESIARRSGVSRGDLLMPMIGTVGGAVEVESDKKFAIKNLALFRTSASSCNTKWLQAVLNSQYVKTQFEYLRSGGVQGFVGLGELRGLRVPVPPPDEQKEIAGQITAVQLKYTPLVAHVHQHIERLREYRSSLISAAVTGQLEIN